MSAAGLPWLRVGSHNARGLCDPRKAAALARAWMALGLHVVAVQETKWSPRSRSDAVQQLEQEGWRVFSSENHIAPTGGGVAVLIQAALLAEGSGPLTAEEVQAVGGTLAGRLLHLRLKWAGHQLHVASVYLPADDTAAQATAAQDVLGPLATAQHAAGWQGIWGGDYNFCPNPALDRQRPASARAAADRRASAAWAQHLDPQLMDVFRARHPAQRKFTHFHRAGASRLDRVYVSHTLDAHVLRAEAANPHAAGKTTAIAPAFAQSDHRPVFVDIVRRDPLASDTPRRRVRLTFRSSQQHWDSFQMQLQALVTAAPTDQRQLLRWWPTFKQRVAAAAATASREARAAHANQEVDANAASLQQLYDAAEDGSATAAAQVAEAAQRLAAASEADMAAKEVREQRTWIHTRERPHPNLTRLLRRPKSATHISALSTKAGRVIRSPAALAETTIQHWAAISGSPSTDPSQRNYVLRSLHRTHAPKLDYERRDALSHVEVSVTEVKAALRRMMSGKSPGLDGIPLELYRLCQDILTPLLARLFTAIWATMAVPPHFLKGLITVLYKSGPTTDPSNYRPITLLGTDYRVFAKVLANRLEQVLPQVIDPQQTAFLRGRSIGDNIMMLQLLPEVLAADGRSAVIAFCDFVKAYDTIDRSFLLASMRRLGVDGRFLSIVRLLLSNTLSCARVNGCLSSFHRFHSGVRQGCPLAPLLYLFIGQALQRFLRDHGVGISVTADSAAPITALQFADDTKVMLPSLQQASTFVALMQTFGEASGQRLHIHKTHLLPVGVPPSAPLPSEAGGLRVVSEATALGLTFHAHTQPPTTNWNDRLAQVRNCFDRAHKLRLSALGRGMASAAYGVSRLLYAAEFLEPPSSVYGELDQLVRQLVLNQRPRQPRSGTSNPSDVGSASGGVRLSVRMSQLVGAPREGGWGVLPWRQHVAARHAKWAARIVDPAAADLPWVAVAQQKLVGFDGSATSTEGLPRVLRRVLLALRSLPPPACQLSGSADPDLAAAAAAMPLAWLLPEPQRGTELHSFRAMLHAQDITTVGRLWRLAVVLLAPCTIPTPVSPLLIAMAAAVTAVVAALPTGWARALAAAEAAGPPLHTVLDSPSWQRGMRAAAVWPAAGDKVLKPWQLSVKDGTRMLMEPVRAERRQLWQKFAALVDSAIPATMDDVADLFKRVWQLPIDNRLKEVVWLLVYDATLTRERTQGRWGQPCVCGVDNPGRLHYFWECPVAVAVVHEIQRCLPAGAGAVRREHLWLARAPPAQSAGCWPVVALAALSAMESARRVGTRRALAGSPASALGIGNRAVARFWAGISSFCALNLAPPDWRQMRCSFYTWSPEGRWQCTPRV